MNKLLLVFIFLSEVESNIWVHCCPWNLFSFSRERRFRTSSPLSFGHLYWLMAAGITQGCYGSPDAVEYFWEPLLIQTLFLLFLCNTKITCLSIGETLSFFPSDCCRRDLQMSVLFWKPPVASGLDEERYRFIFRDAMR